MKLDLKKQTRVFGDFYRDKTVLVTGHTGFKGSWLSTWLLQLGAKPVGYALDPPTEPSNFAACRLAERMVDCRADVCHAAVLKEVFDEHRPEIVFHLAAQPLVRPGFDEPALTFETNIMGTVNVLEAARTCESVRGVVCITSDKCYENQEWTWGYRETDKLGGHDPYSASKACAELAIAVYQDPRFQARSNPERVVTVPICSVRAGNVIGGGDWAKDRLIPDVARAIAADRDVEIRSPGSTRPWQHVLEALSGYLWLATRLVDDPASHTTSYNFGPAAGARGVPVIEVVRSILSKWEGTQSRLVVNPDRSGAESGLLRLDCSKAESELGWHASWDLDETLSHLVSWYRKFYEEDGEAMFEHASEQIAHYVNSAQEQKLAWSIA